MAKSLKLGLRYDIIGGPDSAQVLLGSELDMTINNNGERLSLKITPDQKGIMFYSTDPLIKTGKFTFYSKGVQRTLNVSFQYNSEGRDGWLILTR